MEVETKNYHVFKIDVRLDEYNVELLKTIKDKLGLIYAVRVLRLAYDIPFKECREYIESL